MISSQAKGTMTPLFLTYVKKKVDLLSLACDDAAPYDYV